MDYIRLSKVLSYALRHKPEEYGLELDDQGWAELPAVISALKRKGFEKVQKSDLELVVNSSSKKRHELQGDKIRALYGHSLKKKITKVQAVPPRVLYHGTTLSSIESIIKGGLQPMQRQYVHLSVNKELALVVANRRNEPVCIIEVDALAAHSSGVQFYREENNIWLSEVIPPQFLKIKHETS